MGNVKVFISGSSTLSHMQACDDIFKILNKIKDCNILVGDCRGADFVVQYYFINKVSHVTVHCSGVHPRINLGYSYKTWAGSSKGLKGREFHEVKDSKMTYECDFRVILWDERTKGSLNNIERLKKLNKPYMIFNFIEKTYTYSDKFPPEFIVK